MLYQMLLMVARRRRLKPPAAALSAWAACGFSLLSATRGDGDESARRAAKACMRALRCGGVDGYAMVGGGSTLSSRLANLLSGDVLLRSPPPFRATEEAWERESLTTHTSSAERLLLRKYGLRRFVDEESVITIRADALHWDGSKWLCRTFAEDHMLAINDLLRQQIAQATPALPLGLCHAPFALARPDGADAATWRGEAQGNAQRTDEALEAAAPRVGLVCVLLRVLLALAARRFVSVAGRGRVRAHRAVAARAGGAHLYA